MPLYEYRCDACGDVFEVIQKFSDAPLSTHDGCGGPVVRLLSPPALQFKGTGWYVTDYARKNGSSPSGGNGDKKAGSSTGESKSESKSESPKPSAKSESKSPAS